MNLSLKVISRVKYSLLFLSVHVSNIILYKETHNERNFVKKTHNIQTAPGEFVITECVYIFLLINSSNANYFAS